MGWENHPVYVPLQAELTARFASGVFRFRGLRPVIFLCGGAKSLRRDTLAAYFRKTFAPALVFYAEPVWDAIAARPGINALEMEERLANLADIIPIVVESPGTFCELGAFSLSPPLRKKLLLIMNQDFRAEPSFINTGPVKWVERDSMFKPVYADFSTILLAGGAIAKEFATVKTRKTAQLADLQSQPKLMLFFVMDLLAITSPTTETVLGGLVSAICGSPVDVSEYLGLGEAMGLAAHFVDRGRRFYVRRITVREPLESFVNKKKFDVEEWRARFVSVLLQIPDAARVLRAAGSYACR